MALGGETAATRVADSESFAELLLQTGLVSPENLAFARRVKERTGAHIDEVLISEGLLDSESLLLAEAQSWGIHPVDLEAVQFDEQVARRLPGQTYLAENWMPIRRNDAGTVFVATARGIAPERVERIRALLGGAPVQFVATTSWDIKNAVLRLFRVDIADEAANELFRQNPAMSARTTLSRGQKVGGVLIAMLLTASAVVWPWLTLVGTAVAVSVAYLVAVSFRFVVALRGARFDVVERITGATVAALDDRDLPRYSVLVPAYREAHAMAALLDALKVIDYPTEKLEILLLIEDDDVETRDAVIAANPPPHVRIVSIPAGTPQTKSRACNVGLFFATGELLVIFDVGDVPDADQLKKAVFAFRRGGDDTVCVQASLKYSNALTNVLTRVCALENGYWSDYLLAGLELGDLPVPLGGSSNHFRTKALVELGGWDPFNVTDDADLGVRASALGYRVGVMSSTTDTLAPASLPTFMRHRARWIQGYLQTTLVHMRQPITLIREMGLRRFLSFLLLFGGTPVTYLAVIPLGLIVVVTIVVPIDALATLAPIVLVWLIVVNIALGTGLSIYLSMMGPYKRGAFTLVPWAVLAPAYSLLLSIAAYRGLWQLVSRPHHREKTRRRESTHVDGR